MKSTRRTMTSTVLEYLSGASDLVETRAIARALGITYPQVLTTLVHLAKYRAVEFLWDEAVGSTLWLATPENDTRSRTVEERRPEEGRDKKGGYRHPNNHRWTKRGKKHA